MAIEIVEIKRLKDLSGVGLTEAKAALEASDGDFDKALAAMRKKGLTKADKRSERETRAGLVGNYNHDGRIGVILEVNCETDFVARNEIFINLVKDLAMHIAASNPLYVSSDNVPEGDRQSARSEFEEKAKADGKDARMIDKIIEGQVQKYFGERCLLDQPFVKNPNQTVREYVNEHNARLGENILVRRFARIALGEVN